MSALLQRFALAAPLLGLGLAMSASALLAGCPPPVPPPTVPTEPDLTPDEPVVCPRGEAEADPTCTPEGCLSPPEPEEGQGGAEPDDLDCRRWER